MCGDGVTGSMETAAVMGIIPHLWGYPKPLLNWILVSGVEPWGSGVWQSLPSGGKSCSSFIFIAGDCFSTGGLCASVPRLPSSVGVRPGFSAVLVVSTVSLSGLCTY